MLLDLQAQDSRVRTTLDPRLMALAEPRDFSVQVSRSRG
jgi:hypothetical protein